jgi:hypothetical protein
MNAEGKPASHAALAIHHAGSYSGWVWSAIPRVWATCRVQQGHKAMQEH